jgi:membrane-associated protease RseP (regulator of RpoE activity)
MLEVLTFLLFILTIVAILYKERRKIEIEGILIIRRTKRGKRTIEILATKYSKFFRILMNIAGMISIPLIIISSLYIVKNAVDIAIGATQVGAMLVLPAPVKEAQAVPGVFLMPWYFWVIGIMTVVIPHELFHAIASRLEKIKVKSMGYLFLLFIPGAFVEPDEKKLKRSKLSTKLRVYGAGSFANLLVAGIVFLLSYAMLMIFYTPYGLGYSGIVLDSPAYKVNLSGIIIEINNITITSQTDLERILKEIPPGSAIEIKTTTGIFNLTTAPREDNINMSYIGIAGPFSTKYVIKELFTPMSSIISFISMLLVWIFILNLGIGLVNMLPIKPLDGGMIFESLMTKLSKVFGKHMSNFISMIMLALLLFNLFGSYLV